MRYMRQKKIQKRFNIWLLVMVKNFLNMQKLNIKTKFFGFLSHKDMSKYLIKSDILFII